MKKPLTLIPPAQAEALYDAALDTLRPGQFMAPSSEVRPFQRWGGMEWEEDDSLPSLDSPAFQWDSAKSKAHD
jgi:hypothetical protein